jgi:membrane protein DedA with SNARE-associated domain
MADWIMKMINAAGYPAIALLMFVENVFPPIPSELIMPLVGYMAGQGQLSFIGAVAASAIGSVVGALPLYYLGRSLGEEGLKEWADKHGRWLTVSRRDIERAMDWFDRHGWAAVFLCRLLPGIRSFISLPAGVNRMNLLGFLLCTTAGTTVWASFLAGLGYTLRERYGRVEEYLNPISYALLGAVVVMYFVRAFKHKG